MRITGFRLLVTLLFFTTIASAQQIGEWRSFPAMHDATKSVAVGDVIYTLSSGALYAYDSSDGSVVTYAKHAPLNGTNIFDIELCKATGEVVIVYSDGNIDLLNPDDETVYNVSEFKNKAMSNKGINDTWCSDGGDLYIATDFGLLVFNVVKREFSSTYIIGNRIFSAVELGGTIYLADADGLYTGNRRDNLLDKNKWQFHAGVCMNRLRPYGGSVLAIRENYVFSISPDVQLQKVTTASSWLTFINSAGSDLLVGNETELYCFNSLISAERYAFDEGSLKSVTKASGTFWACCGANGLQAFKTEGAQLKKTVSSIIPNSPIRNYAEYLSFEHGKLLVSGGGMAGVFYNRKGTLMVFDGSSWKNLPDNLEEKTNMPYKDVECFTEDPKEEGHFFAGSAGQGLYEFKNYEFYKLHNISNSPIESAIPTSDPAHPYYLWINGVRFDDNNNLWTLNARCKNTIKVLKSDGTWASVHVKEFENRQTPEKILIDSRGYVWATCMRYNGGLLILDYGGTIDDTSDDRSAFITDKFVNQDGVSYEPYYYNCIAEDRNGGVWFGTENGLYQIKNPSKLLNGDATVYQVKVSRNDGTNTADYLLGGVYVNDIAFDGANRMWVATTDGVYCISEDGQDVLHHFTVENSPLPSNDIASLALNNKTGEVYMGSGSGIVCYASDASEPLESFDEDAVTVYPNPVRPEYRGNITVKGLVFGSNVKIASTMGNVVAEGTSNGGTFVWNGCDKHGRRVVSGVYHVLASNPDGSEGVVAKVLFVR